MCFSLSEKRARERGGAEKGDKKYFVFFSLEIQNLSNLVSLFQFQKKMQGSVADVGANDEQYIAVPLPEAEALKQPRLKSEPRQFGYRAPGFSKPSSCSDKAFRDIVAAINASCAAGDLAIPSLGRLGFHTCGTFSAIGYQGA